MRNLSTYELATLLNESEFSLNEISQITKVPLEKVTGASNGLWFEDKIHSKLEKLMNWKYEPDAEKEISHLSFSVHRSGKWISHVKVWETETKEFTLQHGLKRTA